MTLPHEGHFLTFKSKKTSEISMHFGGKDSNLGLGGRGKKYFCLDTNYTPLVITQKSIRSSSAPKKNPGNRTTFLWPAFLTPGVVVVETSGVVVPEAFSSFLLSRGRPSRIFIFLAEHIISYLPFIL